MENNQKQIYSLCPKCSKNVPRIVFDEDDHDKLMLSCKCGFYINCDILTYNNLYKKHHIPISPSINHCKKHNLYYKYFCDTCNLHFCKKCVFKHSHEIFWKIKIENKENISELRLQLKKCYNHLNKYFSCLKSQSILASPNLKSKIIQSYKQCYKRNKSILDFYQSIFDNYLTHNFWIENFFKQFVTLNIYPYIEDKDANSVCNYFDTYSFYRAKETKIIINGNDIFDSLLILQDKRLAATLERDPLLMIVDPENNYHCDIVISDNKVLGLNSICQLDNGHIVTSGRDNYIKIYSITKNTYKCEHTYITQYSEYFSKVITLSENRILAVADRILKIYNANPPYNLLKELTTYHEQDDVICNVLELKSKFKKGYLAAGAHWEHSIKFWNLKTYQIEAIFNEVECEATNSMIETKNNKLIVGGTSRLSIVDLVKMEIEFCSYVDTGNIWSFAMIDDNTMVSGCTYGKLYMLNVKKREFTLLDEKAHRSFIRAIVVLKNNMFITGADDSNCSLKLWKFN